MVCCCDPFEPLSAEDEKEASDELVKSEEKTPMTADKEETLVSVTLPRGITPGQKLDVKSPDGRRTVEVVIPRGARPGQNFLVKIPPVSMEPLMSVEGKKSQKKKKSDEEEHGLSFLEALDDFLTPKPDVPINMREHVSAREPEPKSEPEPEFEPAPEPKFEPEPERKYKYEPEPKYKYEPEPRFKYEPALEPEPKPAPVPVKEVALPSHTVVQVTGAPVEATVTQANASRMPDINTSRMPDVYSSQAPNVRASQEPDYNASQMPETRQEPEPEENKPISIVKSLEDFLVPTPNRRPTKSKPKHSAPSPDRASKNAQKQNDQYGPKLIQVQVPPGMAAGSTIYVEIPGENRTVAAQVPPDVSTFHVAYTPQRQGQGQSQVKYRTPTPAPQPAPARVAPRAPQAPREKLLSVRVPPRTPPGTVLHVSVPDEPGRILAVQVPPGNVRQFHVSYVPRQPGDAPQTGGGTLPTANAYRGYPQDSDYLAASPSVGW